MIVSCALLSLGDRRTLPRFRSEHRVSVLATCNRLAVASAAGAAIGAPLRVTLDGVAGAQPRVERGQPCRSAGGRELRPTYEVRPDCGQAFLGRSGLDGYALFMPHDRFGALLLAPRSGHREGRAGSASTPAQLRAAYSRLRSRPDRYVHGGRQYFVRRARAPHWELRFDVSPGKRVTQIAFGTQGAVRLDEGCA